MSRRLEAPGLDTLILEPDHGYSVSTIDIGLAEVRAVTAGRVDADGDDDSTEHHGAAAVSLKILVKKSATESAQERLDRLRGFCRPGLRPYLYFDAEDGTERRVRLRADQGSSPWTMPGLREVQVGWRAPDGIVEAAEASVIEAEAAADVEGGRTYPLVHPRTYPASATLGVFEVMNATAEVYPVLELWGPCSGPRIENRDGGFMSFPDLVLGASQWLEVDTREKTVRLNGLANQSRYDDVDFDTLAWPSAGPGVSSWRYFPVSFGDGCHVVARVRRGWQ